MIKFLACLIFVSIVFANYAYASEYIAPSAGEINEAVEKITPTRFLPNDLFYFTIGLKENFSIFFKPSSIEKAKFEFILTSKRLKEVYLLYKNGDYKNSNRTILRYKESVDRTIKQIEKAQMQNQDVIVFADKTANDLVFQEKLILYLFTSDHKLENNNLLIDAFSSIVYKIEGIKPGYRNRYKIVASEKKNNPEQSPEPEILPTGTPFNPKRIIY